MRVQSLVISCFLFGLRFYVPVNSYGHVEMISYPNPRERSDSVVECLSQDLGAAGSSLTGVTMLWSLSKTHLSQLSTGSTQEDPSYITEKLLMGRKESNQTNKCPSQQLCSCRDDQLT